MKIQELNNMLDFSKRAKIHDDTTQQSLASAVASLSTVVIHVPKMVKKPVVNLQDFSTKQLDQLIQIKAIQVARAKKKYQEADQKLEKKDSFLTVALAALAMNFIFSSLLTTFVFGLLVILSVFFFPPVAVFIATLSFPLFFCMLVGLILANAVLALPFTIPGMFASIKESKIEDKRKAFAWFEHEKKILTSLEKAKKEKESTPVEQADNSNENAASIFSPSSQSESGVTLGAVSSPISSLSPRTSTQLYPKLPAIFNNGNNHSQEEEDTFTPPASFSLT